MTARRESLSLTLGDAAATEALGARLAGVLEVGDAVLLDGPLGAGKTTLARGAIRAWTGDADAEAPSPTFTLAQVYDGPKGDLWHVDLYRLKTPEEALELGLEDAFAEAVCLIEWPDRLGGFRPTDAIMVTLAMTGAGRTATIAGPPAVLAAAAA